MWRGLTCYNINVHRIQKAYSITYEFNNAISSWEFTDIELSSKIKKNTELKLKNMERKGPRPDPISRLLLHLKKLNVDLLYIRSGGSVYKCEALVFTRNQFQNKKKYVYIISSWSFCLSAVFNILYLYTTIDQG